MKKIIYRIGMLAVVALAFVACKKSTEGELPKDEVKHVVTVTLGKTIETKTAVVEGESSASYKWNADDDQYLHVYENGTEGTIETFTLNGDQTIATLSVSFDGNAASTLNYSAKYALGMSNAGNPIIQSTQYPKADNFDPSADILISKATTDVTGLTSRPSTLQFTLGRPVTVNKMILTGLSKDEFVKTVEFELTGDVAGYYNLESGNITNGVKKLTFDYTKERSFDIENNQVVVADRAVAGVAPDENGNFPVYFISAPVDAAGIVSVVVTTDKNVYTKSTSCDPNPFDGRTITFAVGTMKRFTMGMAGYGEEIPEPVRYFEVTNDDQIMDGGIYLITSSKTNGNVAMGAYNSSHYDAVNVTVTTDQTIGNYIDIDAEQVLTVTLEDADTEHSYFYIKDADGSYLSYSGSSNNVSRGSKSETDAFKWTVSANEIASVNVSGRKLQYNASSPRFACYSTSQTAIALYYKEGSIVEKLSTPTGLNAEDAGSGTVNVSWNAVSGANSYTVTMTGQTTQTGITETSTSFTGVADGNYTITVTAISNDHTQKKDSSPASTDITVGSPTLSVPTIVSVAQSSAGIKASWNAVENATSYSWTLYDDAELTNPVAGASVNNTTLSAPINATDWLINELACGTTYYFTVSALATGYTSSDESSPVSFDALATKSFTAGEYTEDALTLTKTPITGVFAKGGGTSAPANNGTRIRLYQASSGTNGGTLTITSASTSIHAVEVTFDSNQNYLTSATGTYSSGFWSTNTAVNSVVFYCNGNSSSQRADITGFTVFYDSSIPVPELLEMGDIECDDSGENENSLTFSWDAVDGAEGYQISTDGTNFGNTQDETTYTLENLQPNTTYTIWVKAIGDGTDYLTSAAKQSESGTTKASQGVTYATVNTILWAETFAGYANGSTPTAGGSGTTVYGNGSVTYACSSSSATAKTQIYASDNNAGGTAPELLIQKSSNSGSFTVSGIPTGGAKSMSLTFLSNKTSFSVTSNTQNITISGSGKSWTISNNNSAAETFEIIVSNTGSQNARVDEFEITVTAAHD